MYLDSVLIENVGPIEKVDVKFKHDIRGANPVVFVGKNGSGKSILISYLVNSLLCARQNIFDDTEVVKGRVYKYRNPQYVRSGCVYSYSKVIMAHSLEVVEWQLLQSRKGFEGYYKFTPLKSDWNKIPENESSLFYVNFNNHKQVLDSFVKDQCMLYFPVNRFEEPAWLNYESLTSRVDYTERKNISGYSNRNAICLSPMKEIRKWLLDVLFDRNVLELKTSNSVAQLPGLQGYQAITLFEGFKGSSNILYNAILEILRVVLRSTGELRFGIGNRGLRQISIMRDERVWVPNLFQLSTGEMQLLNIFLSILKDYDVAQKSFAELSEIVGVVVIDEVDSHLHAVHQKEVLPKLMSMFPKVQFVLTSHAPLLLMGMRDQFGDDGFDIVDMPSGLKIQASEFTEFSDAYSAFKATEQFRMDVRDEVERFSKPVVFVEGILDVQYIKKAAELLGKLDILDRIEIRDGGGESRLTSIWKSFDGNMSSLFPNHVGLLFDCETKKSNENKNNIHRRLIPFQDSHPIKCGIENLFGPETIHKIEAEKPEFIDVREAGKQRVRGKNVEVPRELSVNKDEKTAMCEWLCSQGDVGDFQCFKVIFDMIEEIVA